MRAGGGYFGPSVWAGCIQEGSDLGTKLGGGGSDPMPEQEVQDFKFASYIN